MTDIAITRPARYARRPVRVFALFYDGSEQSVLSIVGWLGDEAFLGYEPSTGALTIVTGVRDDGTRITQTISPSTYLVRFYATRDFVAMPRKGFEQMFTEEK